MRLIVVLALAYPALPLAQPGEIVFSGYGGDYGEQMKKLAIVQAAWRPEDCLALPDS
jgi:hypothetical protein